MGRIRIKKDSKAKAMISFEDDEKTLESIILMLKETRLDIKNFVRKLVVFGILLFTVFLIYGPIVKNLYNENYTQFVLLGVIGSIFGISTSSKFSYYSPSFIHFIKNDLKKLGYKFDGKKKYILIFILFGLFSLFLILTLENVLIYADENSNLSLFLFVYLVLMFYNIFGMLIIFFIIALKYIRYSITLKKKYKIKITFEIKKLKFEVQYKDELEAPTIWAILSSNKLFSKNDDIGIRTFDKISKKRGLINYYNCIRLYSNPLNFRNNF